MNNTFNFFTTLLAGFLTFGAIAQCPTGQVAVTVDVATDNWGYESYWEITPNGDACGINTIASFGNTAIGCAGGGLQVAVSGDPGAYGNNVVVTEDLGCLTDGLCIDLHSVDDYGDGLTTFQINFNGTPFGSVLTASSANDTWQVCVSEPLAHDLLVDFDYNTSGWILNHVQPVYDSYYPKGQLATSETSAGIVVYNAGTNVASDVYVRLNIDRLDQTGNYMTVYTDTLEFGSIPVQGVGVGHKNISDSIWHEIGDYRYQYIIYQADVDENPTNDTLTDHFTITENYWSRVPWDANTETPSVDSYNFPGTTSYIDRYEWGSFFYFPNATGLSIDTIYTAFKISSSANQNSFPYKARVSAVNPSQPWIDMETDLTASAVAADTIYGNPGDELIGKASYFWNSSSLEPFVFEENKLYYISIDQENTTPPYLSDGTVTNGMRIGAYQINHDFHSQLTSSESYPFYNPMSIRESGVGIWYPTGWMNSPEPAIGILLSGQSTVSNSELMPKPKELIKILDMMGRETTFKPNTPLIYVYDDGSIEKVFSVEY